YGTGYFIAQLFPEGAANLSRPLDAWNRTAPDPAASALLSSVGTDLVPAGPGVSIARRVLDLPTGEETTLFDLQGAASIRLLRLRAPAATAEVLGDARVRITWDDRDAPSVDAPLSLLFGAGTLYRRDRSTEFLVKSLPATVRFTAVDVELSLYFPMPFVSR